METMVKNDLNQLMQQREDGPYMQFTSTRPLCSTTSIAAAYNSNN
ncbi:hypothetical protein Nizo3400_2150 [Lactiplantibacillus plantarum]|nr:hypothetical protein Nizo3400_2150 [Lactiplantibacillus plantarum]